MYVRKLKNKNGKTYVQIVDKSAGKYTVFKSFGSASTNDDLSSLTEKANLWLKNHTGSLEFDFVSEVALYHSVLNNITSHKLAGIDLVLGKIFDEIGFNQLKISCLEI